MRAWNCSGRAPRVAVPCNEVSWRGRCAWPTHEQIFFAACALDGSFWRHQARARSRLTTALLIIHGLVAVALLGAITHQTLAAWMPARSRPDSFCRRVRAVPSAAFTNAIVILYAVSALLGALLYLPFRVAVRVELERAPAIGKRLGSSNSRSISSPSGWPCSQPTGFVGGRSAPTSSPQYLQPL